MERGPLLSECGRSDSWPLQAALWQKFDAARALATYSGRPRYSDPPAVIAPTQTPGSTYSSSTSPSWYLRHAGAASLARLHALADPVR